MKAYPTFTTHFDATRRTKEIAESIENGMDTTDPQTAPTQVIRKAMAWEIENVSDEVDEQNIFKSPDQALNNMENGFGSDCEDHCFILAAICNSFSDELKPTDIRMIIGFVQIPTIKRLMNVISYEVMESIPHAWLIITPYYPSHTPLLADPTMNRENGGVLIPAATANNYIPYVELKPTGIKIYR